MKYNLFIEKQMNCQSLPIMTALSTSWMEINIYAWSDNGKSPTQNRTLHIGDLALTNCHNLELCKTVKVNMKSMAGLLTSRKYKTTLPNKTFPLLNWEETEIYWTIFKEKKDNIIEAHTRTVPTWIILRAAGKSRLDNKNMQSTTGY